MILGKKNVVVTLSLPSLRVEAAVEGVHDDYTKRSEYTSYLVKSQQKFQDARLQVGAVQTAVNR